MLVRISFLLIIGSLWASIEAYTNVTSTNPQFAMKMKNYYESSLSSVLETLRHVHRSEHNRRITGAKRGRREIPRLKHVYDDRGVFQLMSVEPMFPVCKHNTHVSLSKWSNNKYAVCISNQKEATLGSLNVSGWIPLDSWRIGQGRDSVIFHTEKSWYVVVADQKKAEGTDLLRFNFNQSRMEVDHTIHSRYATAITLWSMDPVGGDIHLAIANSRGPGSKLFQDYTYTYDWRGTYFDHYHSVQSYDVRDLEAFHIYGQTYLAVANRKSAIGVYDVDSEIFRFDVDQWRWKSFQKIRTQAVSDVHFFEMGSVNVKEAFLVVANQFEQKYGQRNYAIDSVIYKFAEGRFVPFQCIRTHGASGVSAYSDQETGIFLLAMSNLYSPVQLYQYDGWKFNSATIQFDSESMAPGVTALAFLPWKGSGAENKKLALVVSNPRKDQESSVFGLSFSLQYSLRQMYSGGIEWCSLAQQRLNHTKTSEMVDILQKAPFAENVDSLLLEGPFTFQDGLSLEGALQTPKVVDLNAGRKIDYSLLFQLESLDRRLFSIKNRISSLKKTLSLALRTYGDQLIKGQMQFDSLSASCTSVNFLCEVSSMETTILNEQNVEDLQSKLILLNETNAISGSLSFQELVVEGNVYVSGFVDGVNISHIVTRNSNRSVHSNKTFVHTLIASNINVQGTLDTVEINDRCIMLTQDNQEVYGETTFTEIEVQDIVIDGLINKVNLFEFYEDVVLVNSGVQRITGQKELKGPLTFRDLHLDTGKINGVDLVDLWNNAVWLEKEQFVSAPWNFSRLALSNPDVNTVNGVQIPGPQFFYPISEGLQVHAHQRFIEKVEIDQLEVHESLNGFNRIQSENNDCTNQLNMVYKNCDQDIYGIKRFGTLTIGGSSLVAGTLNNFDLKTFSEKLKHKAYNLSGNWIFNQVDIRAPVLVKGDLIGWQVENLYRKALKLHQHLPLDAAVTFKNDIQVEHLECMDLNAVDIQRDFFLQHGNTVVTEKKQWYNLLLKDNAKATGTINALNINFLRDVLRDGPNEQVLQTKRIIEGDLIVNNLDLGGRLSGLDMFKAVHLNEDSTFTVPVHLEDVSVERDLFAGSVVVASGFLNDQHFLHTLNNTVLHNFPQQVFGNKIVTENVVIPENSNLEVQVVSKVDLKHLQQDTLYQHDPQLITGNKTFLNPVRFQNLLMNSSINGLGIWELLNNFLLQDVPQTISGNVLFKTDLKVDGIMSVAGLLNRVNIASLEKDIIRKQKQFRIVGNVTLESARVLNDINLSGKIQGVDLSEEAVLMFSDNTIMGRKVFRNMLIDGDLLVDGLINGIYIPDLCHFTARESQRLDLQDVVIRGNVKISDLLTIGPVNDISLQNFRESVVLLDQPHWFRDVKFHHVIFEQAVILNGALNGINLQDFNMNYMSLTQDQDIRGSCFFKNSIIVKGSLHVDHMKTADEKVGEIDIVHLAHHILTRISDQKISSTYIIQGNLILSGDLTSSSSINGLSFPKDVSIKSRSNEVPGPVVFGRDLVVTSDLDLSYETIIQQVDFSTWTSQTLMKTGSFVLTGVKTFSDLHLQNVKASDLFGGTLVSMTTILLKEGDQHFKGKTLFGGKVQVAGSLDASSEINGVHVPKLLVEAVLQNRPSIITGHKIFISPLTVIRLSTVGFVASVNVTELSLLIRRPYDVQVLMSQMAENIHSVMLFNDFLIDAPQRLNYYEEWFQWKVEQLEALTWDYLELHGSAQFLIVSWKIPGTQDCSKLVTYILTDNTITEFSILPSSYAVNIKVFSMNSAVYLAVSNAHVFCNSETGGVHIFTLDAETRIWTTGQILTPLPSSDLSVLLDNPNIPCIASALVDQVVVHCFDKQTNSFVQHQQISLPGVLKVSFTTCQHGVFLASSVFQHGAWSVHVFIWAGTELVPLQILQANYPTARPLLIATVDKVGSQLCLLVLSEGNFLSNYSPPIIIYRFNPESDLFLEDHRLNIRNVIGVHWDRLSSGDIILSLLNVDGVHVYHWGGFAGFLHHTFFHFFGGRNLMGFNTRDQHYLVVSGLACDLVWWQTHYPVNSIFRATIKGV